MKSWHKKLKKSQSNIWIQMLIGFYKLHHGQPIIVGHYSEKKHRRLIEKANNDIKKSIELSDKSQYYEDKARSAENNNAIYR